MLKPPISWAIYIYLFLVGGAVFSVIFLGLPTNEAVMACITLLILPLSVATISYESESNADRRSLEESK